MVLVDQGVILYETVNTKTVQSRRKNEIARFVDPNVRVYSDILIYGN